MKVLFAYIVVCHQKKKDMHESSKWFSIGYYKYQGWLEKKLHLTIKCFTLCVQPISKKRMNTNSRN